MEDHDFVGHAICPIGNRRNMCVITYVFNLSEFWIAPFVVVPLVLRKRVVAFMMAPQQGPPGQLWD